MLNPEINDYLNREMNNVVLSLDGRREINDAMRPNAGGKGSYDTIVPKYQQFVAMRGDKDYYVRGTFTKKNLDFSQDVLHMVELGFDQVSVEPVISDPQLSFAITEEDLPAIREEYDRLARIILERKKAGKGFNFFHFMLDLDQGPCAIKRLRGCGCGNEYAAVDPDGGVFPCHQFVGKPEWQMGNVLTGDYDLTRRIVIGRDRQRPDLPGPRFTAKRNAGNAGRNFIAPAAATPTTSNMRGIFFRPTPSRVSWKRNGWSAPS